jgi:DNA-directed RNA polymerase specialized sigma24 family protein
VATTGSITHWLHQLHNGENVATHALWERYFPRLVKLARGRLGQNRGGIADEEDIALSAFHTFFRAFEAGRLPRLQGRNDLWSILVRITIRKTIDLHGYENRGKRSCGVTRVEADLDAFVAREMAPDFASRAAEEYVRLHES